MSLEGWPERLQVVDLATIVEERDILFPFAMDEVIGKEVGDGVRLPMVHIWRHPRGFVMGLRDRRLPEAVRAMNTLRGQGYEVAVRNSGGAAVPLDPGVVNLSIIIPNPGKSLDFRDDFTIMVDLIKGALMANGVHVEAGEITGAYCPGDFDLSIQGRKFCGIAQRRLSKAFIVQAFVVVEGSGEERRTLVRSFYDQAAEPMAKETGTEAPTSHPLVETGTMASLAELGGPASAEQFIAGVKKWLMTKGETETLSGSELPLNKISEMIDVLRKRYE
ncbi:lipoate--protein ligase family protein [Gorillibacterium massiliense]|uniref:lipoate--protein ligase family protein n=1 Tax=Gorillibacterium massiliense TaxID=1280390 RepID=UPI0004B4D41A|nr:hypothetical protein [Gorillibacterium massiliense]